MEGYFLMPMDEAANSATSSAPPPAWKTSSSVATCESMKDGAIVCNTGHYDCEIKT